MEQARLAVRRLAANLFLRPSVVRAFTEYWLREYTPLAVRTGAPVPHGEHEAGDPGAWMACLVQRALIAPRELVLRSQGGMAVRPDAKSAHHVHVCNWVAPAHDFALALPLVHFQRARLEHVLLCWVPLMAAARRFWSCVAHGNAMGQMACEQFLWGDELANAYRPSLVVAMLYERFLGALLGTVPAADWLTVVPAIVARALEPLRNRALLRREVQHVEERLVLESLEQRLSADCQRDPQAAVRALQALVTNLAALVRAEYGDWRETFEEPAGVFPEDLVDTMG